MPDLRLSPASQQQLPPAIPYEPTAPFEAIAADYFHLEGRYYLVTVDRFSNCPGVYQIKSGTDFAGVPGLIRALREIFGTFGVPLELSSDGGPEFKDDRTQEFLKRWGVAHRLSSAYHRKS